MNLIRRAALIIILVGLIGLTACATFTQPQPIKVGLIAPLSGPLSASGEAIQRGILLAMDEINDAGGLLGRPLELVTRDVDNQPDLGVQALEELAEQEEIVALFGGLFSPVMVAQLETIHARQIPLINPWGSMAAITRNGYHPNYAFRVSVSDYYADEFLARYAVEVIGARRPGILADTTGWGKANADGIAAWLETLGVKSAGIERFDQGDNNMNVQIEQLRSQEADALIMVANAPEGAFIVRGMATLGWEVPVISHWGISGGNFVELAGVDRAEGVMTLQTFSFAGELSPKAAAVLRAYHQRFGTDTADDVLAPVGVAHGYDGMHLLALAITEAGSTDGPQVRTALEQLPPYDGLITRYAPAFAPELHDALLVDDYR